MRTKRRPVVKYYLSVPFENIGNHYVACLLISLMFSTLSNAATPPLTRAVGLYHWGGQYATSMSQGVEQIERLGGRVARVTLSSRYYSDYNAGAGCYPDFTLSKLARETD